ncbi:hypothetical protein [Ovoidimarina sediminis]|nr:hypothetical protein [Rhodophyticola sp. MJ-SS7]
MTKKDVLSDRQLRPRSGHCLNFGERLEPVKAAVRARLNGIFGSKGL